MDAWCSRDNDFDVARNFFSLFQYQCCVSSFDTLRLDQNGSFAKNILNKFS